MELRCWRISSGEIFFLWHASASSWRYPLSAPRPPAQGGCGGPTRSSQRTKSRAGSLPCAAKGSCASSSLTAADVAWGTRRWCRAFCTSAAVSTPSSFSSKAAMISRRDAPFHSLQLLRANRVLHNSWCTRPFGGHISLPLSKNEGCTCASPLGSRGRARASPRLLWIWARSDSYCLICLVISSQRWVRSRCTSSTCSNSSMPAFA
mmetsp:Transcript_57607/g.153898  ORF Transcript_57607/g.153898 Transcript_57607/m.153898 type:complete len:206 (+) Transcript_57607:498-1115(+)